jgi:hypothetical protein
MLAVLNPDTISPGTVRMPYRTLSKAVGQLGEMGKSLTFLKYSHFVHHLLCS